MNSCTPAERALPASFFGFATFALGCLGALAASRVASSSAFSCLWYLRMADVLLIPSRS
jgi:hypothetical protein